VFEKQDVAPGEHRGEKALGRNSVRIGPVADTRRVCERALLGVQTSDEGRGEMREEGWFVSTNSLIP